MYSIKIAIIIPLSIISLCSIAISPKQAKYEAKILRKLLNQNNLYWPIVVADDHKNISDLFILPESYLEDLIIEADDNRFNNILSYGIDSQEKNPCQDFFVPVSTSELIKIAVVSGIAIMLFKNDEEIQEFAQENRTETTDDLATIGEMLGDAAYPATTAAAGYILGLVIKNNKIKKFSLLIGKAMIITGIVNRVMKMSFGRGRPYVAEDSSDWGNSSWNDSDYHSFPSGHTTTAFTVATIIADEFGKKNKLIPILAYSAAALTGLARINDNAHWASDVFVGALIGHLVTKTFLLKSKSKKGFHFFPYVTLDGMFVINISYQDKNDLEKPRSDKFISFRERERLYKCSELLNFNTF